MLWLMVSIAFDRSKKIARVISFDVLSFELDISFISCSIGCTVEWFFRKP